MRIPGLETLIVICDKCGIAHGCAGPPWDATKTAPILGWKIGKHPEMCPKCATKKRRAA
jgi:hypothetical protein